MTAAVEGRCLCGAVTITVARHGDHASACHCGMCRRWSGGALWCVEAPAEAVTVAGPVARHRASSFAERAFCATCGSHLWIRDDAGAVYDLMPGLFDAFRALQLGREVYADRAFAFAALADGHPRISRAEYEAERPHMADAR